MATRFLFGKLFCVAITFGFVEKRFRKNLPLSDAAKTMVDENPYSSPSTTGEASIALIPSAPRTITGGLLFAGTLFLLLMNGQHFTNRIIFLGFVAASAFLWYRFRVRARSQNPKAGRFALIAHLILLVAFAATLPSAYSKQAGFNLSLIHISEPTRPY